MNKGLGYLIIGLIALIGGVICATLLIKKKMGREELDFVDFDDTVDDEEFEHFFSSDDDLDEMADLDEDFAEEEVDSDLSSVPGINQKDDEDQL